MIKPSKTHILTAAALSAALMVPGAMTVPANAAGGHDYASIRQKSRRDQRLYLRS